MLELDLIGGDKVAPPAADWSWSLLNLQIAPEAPGNGLNTHSSITASNWS